MQRIKIIGFLLVFTLFSAQQTLAFDGLKKLTAGKASWYGKKFQGRRTASGAIYDMNDFTCAHRTLPFGTKLLIYNPETHKACVVVVNDRGPHDRNRVVDLSNKAAKTLGVGGLSKVVCYSAKGLAKGIKNAATIAKNAIDVESKANSNKRLAGSAGNR